MEHDSESNSETRDPPRKSLEEYDLIIGRRGSKGFCSSKVHAFLVGWYQQYANTKYKSSMLQEQIYPDFVRHNFKAYRKDNQGKFSLETDETIIIAKLKKEMDVIKVKDKENIDSQKRKGQEEDDDASGSKSPKKKGRPRHSAPSNREEELVTLEGDDLFLEAYMDEIPFKNTGLGDSTTSSAFRAPGFHFMESGPVSVSATPQESSHDYVKDAFQWQEFDSYAIPPSLGNEGGSPTTSTILRSIDSGMYVSPETIPEGQTNEAGTFPSTPMNHTKPSVSWADQTATLDQQYNTPSEMETNSQIPFSENSGGGQKHSETVPASTNAVFDTTSLAPQANTGVDSGASVTQGETLAPAIAKSETSKKKASKKKPKLIPCFNGPSPISFHVLNPSRPTPPLAPKPQPSLVDMMMGAFKHFEQRAEALERENMAVWTRLHQLEMKYESLLPSSNKQDSEAKSEDEAPAIYEV